MRRSARWVGHLLTAVAFVAFVALGFWQYERAQSVTGGFQNLGYALQWPLFAVFAVLAWWRVLVLEARRHEQPGPPPRPAPVVPPRPPAVREDQPDDELAAYNAYLARLAAGDGER